MGGNGLTNITPLAVRAGVFHRVMSWLKLVAPANLPEGRHGSIGTSRIDTSGMCSTHMAYIVVTLEVSHTEMSWLKLVAFRNLPGCVSPGALARPHIGTGGKCSTHVYCIVVTREVSHPEMSPLNWPYV